jgi:NAD dependent epimerase/dehydratase family enzyme
MASQVDAYRARAAEYERKAETLSQNQAAIRDYYGRLAQQWRSLALLAEYATKRTTELKISVFLWGAATGGAVILLIAMYALAGLWGAIAALSAFLIFLGLRA